MSPYCIYTRKPQQSITVLWAYLQWYTVHVSDSTSICSTTPSVADLEDEDSTCSKFLQSESMKGVLENSSSPPPLDINDDAKSLSEVDGVTNSIEPVIEGADDPDVHSLEKAEFESVLSAQDCGPSLGPRPTAASLGIKESIDECMRTAPSSREWRVSIIRWLSARLWLLTELISHTLHYSKGLVQDCSISIVDTLDIPQSCTKSSI